MRERGLSGEKIWNAAVIRELLGLELREKQVDDLT